MARKDQGRTADAGMKLHIADVEEIHGLREHIAALEKQNTNLLCENEKINLELRLRTDEVATITADRDNWRKQALEENSRIDGILHRLRRYLDASEEEQRISKAHTDAYNNKDVAFRELVDFALIPTEVATK